MYNVLKTLYIVDDKQIYQKNKKQAKSTNDSTKQQKPHYSIQMMFNTFPFGRWPVTF